MRLPIKWRGLGQWVLAASVASSAGCLCSRHPVPPPLPEVVEPCQTIPKCSKDHVYVFLLNGADPICKDNLIGVRDSIFHLGYDKTYYGQFYHARKFADEIRCIHHHDPDARVFVIGFSCGANAAAALTRQLGQEEIPIDVLMYIGGDTLTNDCKYRPGNVGKVINVMAQGCLLMGGDLICNGAAIDGAENYRLNTSHANAPTHPVTMRLIGQELIHLAASVPFVIPEEPIPLHIEEAPTPRPVPTGEVKAETDRDEWDFLKPVSRVGVPYDYRPASRLNSPTDDALTGLELRDSLVPPSE
ncbi:MAG: hypothetical protein ACK4RK_16870 [Gemmataceae bacterium]